MGSSISKAYDIIDDYESICKVLKINTRDAMFNHLDELHKEYDTNSMMELTTAIYTKLKKDDMIEDLDKLREKYEQKKI